MALTEQQINDLKARYSTPTKATGAARPVEDVATRMARIKASVPTQAPEEGFFSKAGSFLKEATMGNTLRFGKTAGEALAAPENADKYAQVMESHSQIQDDLSKKIAENKKAGKDTSRLEATLNQHIASTPRIEDFTGEVINKTTGQVLGEAAGTVLEATTGGILSGFGKGTGILSNVARTAKKAEKAKLAYDALSFGGKAAKIGMDTAKLAATTVPFAYAYDVSSGLQGMRGEERTGGAAFIPGMSTAIGTAIPLTVGGVRLAKAGVVSAAKEMIPRLSANLGAAPEGAYRQAQKGGVSEFMGARYSGKGAETVESVFDAARQSGKNLKSMNSREWKSTVDAITKEFTGRRIGLPQKETSTLQKIAEKFGFEDRLPKNLGNMSAKETIDLITEINDIGVVKYADDPLTKNLKVALGDIKKVLKGKAINEFGGAGGTFETFYKTQSAQRNVLSNIEAIVGNLATDPNPVSRVTLQNRLQKIFDADKTAYFNAIKSLDDVTGSRLLDKVAAAQLSPILPKGLKGGPSGIIGVASDLLQITTIPLSSPRMSNWLLSKASGYDSVVINNIMKSSPVVRQAIYKLVNEKHMTLNEAIDDVWTKIQKTPNKQGGFVGIGAMGDDISGGANKMLNKTRIADLEANIKAFQKLKQTPEVIADIAKKKQELTMLKYGINNSKDLYDTTKAFGANTRNVTKEVKEVAKNLEKESTFEVKGFNAANPIDTATEVIEGHIKKMKDMLADPDLASMAKGQEKEMLAGLKVDIIDGLKASGFTDEANKMAEKLKNVNSLDEILKINFNEGTIPEIVTESIKQAKASGQSFDEWVKGQGDEILHGTDKKFTDFDKTKIGLNEPNSRNNSAFYFTDSLDTAKSYGKNIVKRYGKFEKPITLDAEGKSYIDFRENLIDAMEKAKKEGNDVVIIKNLSDRKDWGNYEPATHYAVIDTNKLKTRSQLKAEWDKIGDNGVVFNTDAVKITGASNLTKGTIPEIVTKSIKQAKASGQSFDEWVKGQMKPHYIDIKDIKSSLDADTFSTLKGIPRSRNIDLLSEYKSKVKKIEKSPVGREVTNPISIEINVDGGDGYRIIDGNHRYLQAIKNGNNKILAQFKSPKGTSEEGKNIFQIKTLSQLKAEWDKILVK